MSVTDWVGNSSVPKTNWAETVVLLVVVVKSNFSVLASFVLVPDKASRFALEPDPGRTGSNSFVVLVIGMLAVPEVSSMPSAKVRVGVLPELGASTKSV